MEKPAYKPQAKLLGWIVFACVLVVLMFGMIVSPRPTLLEVASVVGLMLLGGILIALQELVDMLKKWENS